VVGEDEADSCPEAFQVEQPEERQEHSCSCEAFINILDFIFDAFYQKHYKEGIGQMMVYIF
jgi:hypothetical protein